MNGADYSIQIKVRNGPLLRAMRENGYWNVRTFCMSMNALGRQSDVSDYLNLKKAPINSWGKWRPLVLKMADALKRLPEDLFPPQHIKQALRKNVAEIDANLEDVTALLVDNETPETALITSDGRAAVNTALSTLLSRYRAVIEMRFGLNGHEPLTLEETARNIGVTRERIRQIEAKAMRKLGAPHMALKTVLEAIAEPGAA